MSIRSWLTPALTRAITSPRRVRLLRRWRAMRRRLTGRARPTVFYFRVDDPYAWLMLQVLPELARHFGLRIEPRVLLYVDERLYPAPEMLGRLAPDDAVRLARLQELEFPRDWQQPDPDAAFHATRILLRHEHDPAFWQIAGQLCRRLWSGDTDGIDEQLRTQGGIAAEQARLELETRRDSFLDEGHYLTATLYHDGEWYWSLERLDHLALRLRERDPALPRSPRWYGAAKKARLEGDREAGRDRTLELFFSFRSPYSWIALTRTFQLADHYQLKLVLRPVLMRGLRVPPAKRLYILRDAAREAHLNGVPFGRICDPVGAGVERCMALWPFAEKEGRLRAWLLATSEQIWSQGQDMSTDRGLGRACEAAGLNWNRARRWLDDDGWRGRAEANRAAMMAAGSWGVPSFRLNGHTVWGQDRVGVLEQLLLSEPDKTGAAANLRPDKPGS